MKPLTTKEEEIMNRFWEHGEMKISELQALYEDPRPHVNTLSTLVKILEEKRLCWSQGTLASQFPLFCQGDKGRLSQEFTEGCGG